MDPKPIKCSVSLSAITTLFQELNQLLDAKFIKAILGFETNKERPCVLCSLSI
jgi:hypothetical protein